MRATSAMSSVSRVVHVGRLTNPVTTVSDAYLRPINLQPAGTLAAILFVGGALAVPFALASKPGFVFGVFLLSLAWSAACMLLAMIRAIELVELGGARVSIASPLRFEPRFRVSVLALIGSVLASAAGLVVIASWFDLVQIDWPGGTPVFEAGFLILGLCGLIGIASRRFRPAALTFDEDGVWWWGIFGQHSIDWELLNVTVGAKRQRRFLVLTDRAGRSHTIEQTFIGSDPAFVAEVLLYYRDHPRDRHTLNEPLDALRLVADIRTDA